MGLIYLFLKLYPFFAIPLSVLSFDLARNFKRKGNAVWIGMVIFGALFLISAAVWIVFRGDKNVDQWFKQITSFVQ